MTALVAAVAVLLVIFAVVVLRDPDFQANAAASASGRNRFIASLPPPLVAGLPVAVLVLMLVPYWLTWRAARAAVRAHRPDLAP